MARMRLLPDLWQISAYEGGEELDLEGAGEVSVVTGQTNQLEFLTEPPSKITGTVHYPDGSPAVGAVVFVNEAVADKYKTKTDANGRYELTWKSSDVMGDDVVLSHGQQRGRELGGAPRH